LPLSNKNCLGVVLFILLPVPPATIIAVFSIAVILLAVYLWLQI
jgi:hypothetical protein